jgi:hypothetical protein
LLVELLFDAEAAAGGAATAVFCWLGCSCCWPGFSCCAANRAPDTGRATLALFS